MTLMKVLGINNGHDASAALIVNGEFVEIISEERFSRFKVHHGIPKKSIEYIRQKYNIEKFDLVVAVSISGKYTTPLFGESENANLRKRKGEKLFIKSVLYKLHLLQIWRALRYVSVILKKPKTKKAIYSRLRELFPTEEIMELDHHLAHAWSSLAFTEKPNSDCIVITMDAEGDGLSGSVNRYEGNEIKRVLAIPSGVAVATLYGKVTEYLGMRRNEHEYKLMGLAPYAKTSDGQLVCNYFKEILNFDKKTLQFKSKFNLQYAKYQFLYDSLSNHRFDSIALGIQLFTEEIVLEFIKAVREKFPSNQIYLSGGTFMNIKLNQVLNETIDSVFSFTPSCGDDSLSIGAAKFGYDTKSNSFSKPIKHLYLGSEYSNKEIHDSVKDLDKSTFTIKDYTDTPGKIEEEVANLLAKNEIVARFKNRMEWGARALGNRSILANPSDKESVKKINEAIKNRDFWMPFAPTVLDTYATTMMESPKKSPYMMIGFNTKPKEALKTSACIHPYDKTCRPQILIEDQNPDYYRLIKHFQSMTDLGVVLNTSFNIHGSPIVESPYDAINTLKDSGLKHLAIGDYLISKT